MKAPGVPIVAAFVAGIALGNYWGFLPGVWMALGVAFLLAGLCGVRRKAINTAFALALAGWLFLGALASSLELRSRPVDNAAALIASGRIDSNGPLRWRGRLRSNPVRLPGGIRYDVELDGVQTADTSITVSGGLRATLFASPRDPQPPVNLLAGDRAEFFAQARQPRNYLDPGAFDMRAYYQRQQIHLLGTLRDPALVRKLDGPPPAPRHRLARLRGRLLEQLDALFAQRPAESAILRAMLLGDRGFLDNALVVDFQKTAVYHVLVIAGLHVAALAWFVMWLARKLRLRMEWRVALTLLVLAAFVAVVEDRPPILRAALMATLLLAGMLLYRRVEAINTVAIAALGILAFRPSALSDSSFQLSFLAVGTIAVLGVPWLERSSEPYRRALQHLGDVTRDPALRPRAVQFRLDARATAHWLESHLPQRLASLAALGVTLPCGVALRLWEMVTISFVLQLGMLPLLAAYFHRVSLAGPVANLPALLLTGILVPLGFMTLAASLVWPPLAAVLARPLGWLTSLLVGMVRWFAAWPRLSYRIPGPPVALLIAFLAALAGLGFLACAKLKNAAPRGNMARARSFFLNGWPERVLALVLAALAICVATYPFSPRIEQGRLETTVLDVGQGDSIFLAFPDGRTMLVDGGGLPGFGQPRGVGYERSFDIGEQVVSPYLWERGLKHIDVVALSHAHQDHLGGLGAVLDNFAVGELWVGRDVHSAAFENLLAEATAHGTTVVHHHRGDALSWGAVHGLVLWPESGSPTERGANDDSLVLRFEYQSVGFLLPGDIEREVEEQLAARGDPLRADVLKIAHHGSRTSSTGEFLAAVAPRVEIISAGENNPYGHPNAEVLARLAGHGARMLRTDRDGAVSVSSDGRTLQVHSFAGDPRP